MHWSAKGPQPSSGEGKGGGCSGGSRILEGGRCMDAVTVYSYPPIGIIR